MAHDGLVLSKSSKVMETYIQCKPTHMNYSE